MALALLGAAGVQASPIFQFTWTSVDNPPGSVVGVTFTGEIFGLPDNGSGPASDVVLDSITGATPIAGTPFANLPIDLFGPNFDAIAPISFFTQNQFVVQNDVITSADFVVESGQDSQIFILGEGPALIDYLSGGVLTSSPPDVVLMFANPYSSAGYYGTATYTLVSSAPEPSAFTLTLFALALVLIYRSARRAICNSCARKALLADRGTNV